MSESLADKLHRLFTTIGKPDGGYYTIPEAASAITTAGQIRMSKQYLYMLCNGTKTNPTLDVLEALARLFDVPLEYFADSAQGERIRSQLDLAEALRRHDVQQVALRAVNLTPDQLATINDMMRHLESIDDDG